MVLVDKLVNSFLSALPKRQQEVIEGRYGLKNGRDMTLAALGNRYGVTRERIRQIQNLSLNEIRAKTKENGLDEFVKLASTHMESVGGLRRDDMLIADLGKLASDSGDKNTFSNRVRFLLEASNKFKFHPADKDYHAFWYVDGSHFKKAASFISNLVKAVSNKKEVILKEKNFDQFFVETAKASNIKDMVGANLMVISKKFMSNSYGDAGLSAWAEINPKTSRDFAYLVLKKESKPLHFTSIAECINKVRPNKKTNYQTVHNELIKDERFVLVGRGIYGLKEFGLISGTAREVISLMLKKHGPLRSKEVVRLVLAERPFKENTLLLNLQNKNHFKRLDDGRYHIKEV